MLRYILVLAAVCWAADAYKVLVIFSVPSQSHSYLGRALVNSLLKHSPNTEVTYITPFPSKKQVNRLSEIDVSHLQPLLEISKTFSDSQATDMNVVKQFANNITRITMETPAVKDAIISQEYDAVITEWFFTDAFAGFAAVLKCPWIIVGTTVLHPHTQLLMDTLSSPAVVPLMMHSPSIPMDFCNRIKNTFYTIMMLYSEQIASYGESVAEYEKYFEPLAKARGVVLPAFSDAVYNASIMLVNSHPSISHAVSLPPNVIDIGGYHIEEDNPKLPEDLQKYLDEAKNGLVYFSMGSVFKSSYLPKETREEVLRVLGELPCKVLWKFETELENLPKNVRIMKWVPQQSVLAHPNVKVFITHGGLLSNMESVYYGVPVIAVPMFGDQPANAERAVSNGFALKVQYSTDASFAQQLGAALKEMLNDDRYSRRAKEISLAFKSRPVSPSKLIAYYLELAIETKGAFHLRTKALLYPFYQRLLLDQLALLLGVLLLAYWGVKKLVSTLCKKKDVKGGKKTKKN